ncbi:MAG TPA: hypothetical protein VGI40_10215 [Pirellulaceae bacterium]|jgi:hypothetical protein
MKSQTLRSFWKCYHSLPQAIRKEARKAYRLFRTNPKHPSLHFHRLQREQDCWSVRVTQDFRAVGIVERGEINWIWIGSHEDFDKAFPK